MLLYLLVAVGNTWPTLSEVDKGGAEEEDHVAEVAEVEVSVDIYKAGKGEEDRQGEEEGEDREQEAQTQMTSMQRLIC